MSTDPAACFTLHHATVCRWAFAMTGRLDEAHDVAQEVFSRMVADRPNLQHAAAVRGWLRTVTARVVVDRWRADHARIQRESQSASAALRVRPPPHPTLDDAAAAAESRQRIRAALAGLTDQQRRVVMAKCFDGLTFAEIAQETGLALGTVKTHYLRALESLRDTLRSESLEWSLT